MESLERLQGLYADLVAFTEQRLANLDRLFQEAEECLEDFRGLLDSPPVTQEDRNSYNAGKLSVYGDEYSINDEFKHISRSLGFALGLDEVQAGQTLIRDYGSEITPSVDFIAKAVADFHDRRDLILQNTRLIFQEAEDADIDENQRMVFHNVVKDILDLKHAPLGARLSYMERCLSNLESVEKRHAEVTAHLENRDTVGEIHGPAYDAILEFQRSSLFKQHEALACIVAYNFRAGLAENSDLLKLENTARRSEKLDLLLLHYLPAFSAAFKQFGSADGAVSFDRAKLLHDVFGAQKPDRSASLTEPFFAALRLLWTAEYSSWYPPGRQYEEEAKACAKLVKSALKDNALELFLSICKTISIDSWRHPARQELVSLLLHDAGDLSLEGDSTSDYFRCVLMESLETFSESWISNMPDSIRLLKNEEDDLRLDRMAAMQEGGMPDANQEHTVPLHLESFLILISFAFEGRPEASEQWWDDPESNLYGFLQWASKRQTVPRVSAFCEMLCSIANGADGALAAHKFLLEESVPVASSRSRRIPSMNYAQIFAELQLYSQKVHERAPRAHIGTRTVLPTDMNEPESPVMLSSYLRLIAYLCRHSPEARSFIFNNPAVDLPKILLMLSSGPIPSYLRASIFATLEALLTGRDWSGTLAMWRTIDEWASSGHEYARSAASSASTSPQTQSLSALQSTLASVSTSLDQYDAFICLLRALLIVPTSVGLDAAWLPFPEDLGSSYRALGVQPYIDFVCGQIFAKRVFGLGDESQGMVCTFHCLDLIAVGFESFNEGYVALLNSGSTTKGQTMDYLQPAAYAQRHPFARLMQWMLSAEMDDALLKRLHRSVSEVESAYPDSPLVLGLQRTIDVVTLVLDLQPTYFDIVKPLLKDGSQERSLGGQTSIEEHIFAHPEIILDLCQYAISDHLDLSLRALSLLQKLSSSPKLNNHFLVSNPFNTRSKRVVDALGPNATATLTTVSEAIRSKLKVNPRELENGAEAAGYQTKDGILAFFNACLETQPELANVAHILLGFQRLGERLTIAENFVNGTAVFDAVVEFVRDYPHGEEIGYAAWLIHLKSAAIQVLRHLWTSPVSIEITIGQLRRYRMLQALIVTQETISDGTLWDGKVAFDPNFWFSTSAEALAEFLTFRSAMYLYASSELRAAADDRLTTALKSHMSTLLGKSADESGAPISHSNIFDLGDFMEVDLSAFIDVPEPSYFPDFDPNMYMSEATDDKPALYDGSTARDVLEIWQKRVLQTQTQSSAAIDAEQMSNEAESILACIVARNRITLARQAWKNALAAYVDLVIATVDCCPMEPVAKTQFILQMLQLLLPKLDTMIADESRDTIDLARAADALMFALPSTTYQQDRMDNIITEKLFQLFRTCIDGILISGWNASQRSVLYSVCCQYLNRIMSSSVSDDTSSKARMNGMDCVRSAGARLISILSDDAEDGVDACRLHALNLLALLTTLARSQKSSHILDSLVKANTLEILIDPLKHVSADFQDAEPSHRHVLLQTYEHRFLLLLQTSLTRPGATAILDAGLATALRESLLFAADPDLGLTSFQPSTTPPASASASTQILTYYALLLPPLRLLASLLTSRGGSTNAHSVHLARNFLSDYRANMVGIFKKYIGVNGAMSTREREALAELVRCYCAVAAVGGWVEWEDESVLGEGAIEVRNPEGGANAVGMGTGAVRKKYGFS